MIYDTLVRVLLAVTQTHTRAHSFILLRRECSTRHGVPRGVGFFFLTYSLRANNTVVK